MSVQPMITAEFQTPFLGIAMAPEAPVTATARIESPFLSEYWGAADVPQPVPAESQEFVGLLEELWDPEFDELVEEVANEARAAVDQRFAIGEVGVDPATRERFVERWLEPLREQAEQAVQRLAEAVSEVDPATLGEAEFEALLEAVDAGETEHAPEFEGLFGRFAKAVKGKFKQLARGAFKKVKQGVKAIAKVLPLKWLLAKLAPLVPWLVKRIGQISVERLPANLRPAATALARRLLGPQAAAATRPAGAGPEPATPQAATGAAAAAEPEPPADAQTPTAPPGSAEPQEPAAADPAVIQHEFDLAAASLLFAADETEGEIALAETLLDVEHEDHAMSDLDAARARFVLKLTTLEDHEDPMPAVQEYVGTIMSIVRMAIGAFGRDRVARVLVPMVSAAIRPMVGPQSTVPLATAIVDAGLTTLGVPAKQREAAAKVLAATVEDTVLRLAEVGDELELEHEHEDVLAQQAYAAFEAAAAANMPPAMIAADLRPTAAIDGMWAPLPGDRGRKYTRLPQTTITLPIARQLKTFGGVTLERYLLDEARVTLPAQARAHLYEALPGSTLFGLLAGDGVPLPSRLVPAMHPLSREAAGLLFGEPGLGRDVSPAYVADRSRIAAGERFVRFEFPGAQQVAPAARTRPTRVGATFDVRPGARLARVAIFLSESDAQRLAALAGRGPNAAAFATALRAVAGPQLDGVLRGQIRRHTRVVAPGDLPRRRSGWLRRLHAASPAFAGRLSAATFKALAAHAGLGQQLAAAALKDTDGVTVLVTLHEIAGIEAAVARDGRVPVTAGAPARSSVQVVAGFRA